MQDPERSENGIPQDPDKILLEPKGYPRKACHFKTEVILKVLGQKLSLDVFRVLKCVDAPSSFGRF